MTIVKQCRRMPREVVQYPGFGGFSRPHWIKPSGASGLTQLWAGDWIRDLLEVSSNPNYPMILFKHPWRMGFGLIFQNYSSTENNYYTSQIGRYPWLIQAELQAQDNQGLDQQESTHSEISQHVRPRKGHDTRDEKNKYGSFSSSIMFSNFSSGVSPTDRHERHWNLHVWFCYISQVISPSNAMQSTPDGNEIISEIIRWNTA